MAFSSGAQLQGGTAANLMNAIGNYFFQPVINTIMQPEIINVLVILCSVAFLIAIAKTVLGKLGLIKNQFRSSGSGLYRWQRSVYKDAKYSSMKMRRRKRRMLRRENRRKGNVPLSSYDSKEYARVRRSY